MGKAFKLSFQDQACMTSNQLLDHISVSFGCLLWLKFYTLKVLQSPSNSTILNKAFRKKRNRFRWTLHPLNCPDHQLCVRLCAGILMHDPLKRPLLQTQSSLIS